MPTSLQVGHLCNAFRVVHIPSMVPTDFLASPPLVPFALVNGGAAMVSEVVAVIAAVDDIDLRLVLLTLSVQLAPNLVDTIAEAVRRVNMTDIVDVLSRTHTGQELVTKGRAQGLEQGRDDTLRSAVREVLEARFPAASAELLDTTTARLLAAHPQHPVRAAMSLAGLDTAG